jgi:hypothetical protein
MATNETASARACRHLTEHSNARKTLAETEKYLCRWIDVDGKKRLSRAIVLAVLSVAPELGQIGDARNAIFDIVKLGAQPDEPEHWLDFTISLTGFIPEFGGAIGQAFKLARSGQPLPRMLDLLPTQYQGDTLRWVRQLNLDDIAARTKDTGHAILSGILDAIAQHHTARKTLAVYLHALGALNERLDAEISRAITRINIFRARMLADALPASTHRTDTPRPTPTWPPDAPNTPEPRQRNQLAPLPPNPYPAQPLPAAGEDFLELNYRYSHNMRPVAGASYTVELNDGTLITGTLDRNGHARIENIPAASVRDIRYGYEPTALKAWQKRPANPIRGQKATTAAETDRLLAQYLSEEQASLEDDYFPDEREEQYAAYGEELTYETHHDSYLMSSEAPGLAAYRDAHEPKHLPEETDEQNTEGDSTWPN